MRFRMMSVAMLFLVSLPAAALAEDLPDLVISFLGTEVVASTISPYAVVGSVRVPPNGSVVIPHDGKVHRIVMKYEIWNRGTASAKICQASSCYNTDQMHVQLNWHVDGSPRPWQASTDVILMGYENACAFGGVVPPGQKIVGTTSLQLERGIHADQREMPSGKHQICLKVIVDTGQFVVESNEGNNSAENCISVDMKEATPLVKPLNTPVSATTPLTKQTPTPSAPPPATPAPPKTPLIKLPKP